MDKPKYIKNWQELAGEKSDTHTLEIDECCGWINPKNDDGDDYYLSTHTFYGDGSNEYYTKILQKCGFNVQLANWDELQI